MKTLVDTQTIFRYGMIFLFSFLTNSVLAQKDSIEKLQDPLFTYHKIGIDVSKLISSPLMKNYDALEFQYTTKYKKNLWMALEFGVGNSIIDNAVISYKSTNSFMRLGIDKVLFNPEFAGDYSNAFVGLRYGAGLVNRSSATYNIQDTIWASTQGQIESNRFLAHWIELTAGFSVEVRKHLFAGWQVRFKSFINPSNFELLPPSYLAGFGKADQNTAFSYNFYLNYGFGKRN